MTEDQQRRKAEFDKLFDSLPGKNMERLRAVSGVLYCKINTVRIWRLKKPSRVIPDGKLKILQRHFNPQQPF